MYEAIEADNTAKALKVTADAAMYEAIEADNTAKAAMSEAEAYMLVVKESLQMQQGKVKKETQKQKTPKSMGFSEKFVEGHFEVDFTMDPGYVSLKVRAKNVQQKKIWSTVIRIDMEYDWTLVRMFMTKNVICTLKDQSLRVSLCNGMCYDLSEDLFGMFLLNDIGWEVEKLRKEVDKLEMNSTTNVRTVQLDLIAPWYNADWSRYRASLQTDGEICALNGLIYGGSSPESIICILPPDARPRQQMSFMCLIAGSQCCGIELYTNGKVELMTTITFLTDGTGWLSLAGIVFFVAPIKA